MSLLTRRQIRFFSDAFKSGAFLAAVGGTVSIASHLEADTPVRSEHPLLLSSTLLLLLMTVLRFLLCEPEATNNVSAHRYLCGVGFILDTLATLAALAALSGAGGFLLLGTEKPLGYVPGGGGIQDVVIIAVMLVASFVCSLGNIYICHNYAWAFRPPFTDNTSTRIARRSWLRQVAPAATEDG